MLEHSEGILSNRHCVVGCILRFEELFLGIEGIVSNGSSIEVTGKSVSQDFEKEHVQ